MPRASVWFIRAALSQLLLGVTLGALLLANKGVPLTPTLWQWLPAHQESLLLGWTLQLIVGVAFWILPRFRTSPERGATWPVAVAWGLLNLGVLLVETNCAFPVAGLVLTGRGCELTAGLVLAGHAWPRIKAFGR